MRAANAMLSAMRAAGHSCSSRQQRHGQLARVMFAVAARPTAVAAAACAGEGKQQSNARSTAYVSVDCCGCYAHVCVCICPSLPVLSSLVAGAAAPAASGFSAAAFSTRCSGFVAVSGGTTSFAAFSAAVAPVAAVASGMEGQSQSGQSNGGRSQPPETRSVTVATLSAAACVRNGVFRRMHAG